MPFLSSGSCLYPLAHGHVTLNSAHTVTAPAQTLTLLLPSKDRCDYTGSPGSSRTYFPSQCGKILHIILTSKSLCHKREYILNSGFRRWRSLGTHDPIYQSPHCLPPKGSQWSHLQNTSTPSLKVSTGCSINSESVNLILNLISSIIWLRYETLGLCLPGAQLLSICGLLKLEDELSSPNIQL